MEDYECIKSVSALEDKEKEIREKDDLLNKAVECIENIDIVLKLLKILLKELERVL